MLAAVDTGSGGLVRSTRSGNTKKGPNPGGERAGTIGWDGSKQPKGCFDPCGAPSLRSGVLRRRCAAPCRTGGFVHATLSANTKKGPIGALFRIGGEGVCHKTQIAICFIISFLKYEVHIPTLIPTTAPRCRACLVAQRAVLPPGEYYRGVRQRALAQHAIPARGQTRCLTGPDNLHYARPKM